jgi:hypothetical protein
MAAALPAAGSPSVITLPGVFKGRELTRKDRRLGASLEPANTLLEGGIPRGRISEIVGRRSCGKTSLAAAFISSATHRGEAAAVIDLANAFDPSTMAAAGVDLSRVLWVSTPSSINSSISSTSASTPYPMLNSTLSPTLLWERAGERVPASDTSQVLSQFFQSNAHRRPSSNGAPRAFLRAAEMVLEAGGFGLLVMDFGERAFTLTQSSSLRLARMAERSGTAVLILATRPACGTFAALTLDLTSSRPIFSRGQSVRPNLKSKQHLKYIGGPFPNLPSGNVDEGTQLALFEGLEIKATLRRNKIGRCGMSAQWRSMISPPDFSGAGVPARHDFHDFSEAGVPTRQASATARIV